MEVQAGRVKSPSTKFDFTTSNQNCDVAIQNIPDFGSKYAESPSLSRNFNEESVCVRLCNLMLLHACESSCKGASLTNLPGTRGKLFLSGGCHFREMRRI